MVQRGRSRKVAAFDVKMSAWYCKTLLMRDFQRKVFAHSNNKFQQSFCTLPTRFKGQYIDHEFAGLKSTVDRTCPLLVNTCSISLLDLNSPIIATSSPRIFRLPYPFLDTFYFVRQQSRPPSVVRVELKPVLDIVTVW